MASPLEAAAGSSVGGTPWHRSSVSTAKECYGAPEMGPFSQAQPLLALGCKCTQPAGSDPTSPLPCFAPCCPTSRGPFKSANNSGGKRVAAAVEESALPTKHQEELMAELLQVWAGCCRYTRAAAPARAALPTRAAAAAGRA